ncbi:MAG TPA: GAP family protein [Pseudonocardia sp.]|nr:GAP family protein [Pseudonocardia sp.]
MTSTDYLTVTGLALIDSLNFSLILGTLYLLISGNGRTRRALGYLGVFYVVYLVTGALLLSGLLAAGDVLQGGAGSYLQLAVGLVMFGYGIFAKPTRPRASGRRSTGPATGTVLGIGLAASLAEVATALPYFGALAIIGSSGSGLPTAIPILFAYNLVVIAPCLALVAVFRLAPERVRGRLEKFWERHRERGTARKGFLLLCAVAGYFVTADALVQLEFFGLVDI